MPGIHRSIGYAARALASAAVLAVAVAGSASVTGCGGGGGDDAAGPSASLCSSAVFDGASIGFNLGCSSYSASISGITYDQFSRVTSYNYDISCTGGSNRRTGSLTNITYNNLGAPLTWNFTVNGQSCRKP